MAAEHRPRNARSRRTRAALLDAARRITETEGLETLTMARVADEAGVSRRAVYLHVASRAELVTALFRYVNEQEDLEHSIAPVWNAGTAEEALAAFAHHVARYHPRVLAVTRAVDRVRRVDPDAEQLWHLVSADWYRACRRLTTWLARDGRLAAPWTATTAAQMLWGLMSYDLIERLLVDRGWSQHRFGELYGQLLRSTFVADPRPGSVQTRTLRNRDQANARSVTGESQA